jgi:hypothetical protein
MKRRTFIFLMAGFLALAILAGGSATSSNAQADSLNQAAVIVRLDKGVVESRCVAFDGESISGLDLITRSGLDVDLHVAGLGSAVCSVEGTGCAADDCFCQCAGGDECVYWSYWHQTDSSWEYARAGANSYKISQGDVDGWSWGPGTVAAAIEPPLLPFEEICSQDAILSIAETDPPEDSGPSLLSLAAFSGIALLIVVGLVLARRSGKE